MKKNNSKKNNNNVNNNIELKLKLPRDTCELLDDKNIDNIGLKLNKYIEFIETKENEKVQNRTNNKMLKLSFAQKNY